MNRRIMSALALCAAAGLWSAPAAAAENAMKVCGAKYQAAKTLPAGQTWAQFLAQCRKTMPATAAMPAPAAKPAMATVAP
ncbi:MAG: hypothetical protein H0X36_06180, partial [Sphingomonadaceae bacterium]|nr:hypothetical protein [Sphingomonadaceae bacterium]